MEEGESEGNIVEEDRMIAKEDTKRVASELWLYPWELLF